MNVEDYFPIEAPRVRLELADPECTIRESGLAYTLRVIAYDQADAIRSITEQDVVLLPLGYDDDPRVHEYLEAWRAVTMEQLRARDVAREIFPVELVPNPAIHPLRTQRLVEVEEFEEALRNPGATGAPATLADTEPIATNTELERAIEESPDDVECFQVYADWLQSHDDPRGELIALQVDPQTLHESWKCLSANQSYFLGPLALYDGDVVHLTWRWGYIDHALLRVSYEHFADGLDGVELFVQLMSLPSARWMRELALGVFHWEGDNDYDAMLRHLAASPRPMLRSLFIGDTRFEEQEISWTRAGDLSGLPDALPRLEELRVHAGSMSLGDLAFPTLRTLRLETGGFTRANLESVTKASLPRLECLEIWFGSPHYGAECAAPDIEPLLERARFPAMRRLGLMNAEFTGDLIGRLAACDLTEGLQELDLSMGTLKDDEARSLLANAERFTHLSVLDLSANYLSTPCCDEIQERFPQAVVDQQKVADRYEYEGVEHVEYYVSVGE